MEPGALARVALVLLSRLIVASESTRERRFGEALTEVRGLAVAPDRVHANASPAATSARSEDLVNGPPAAEATKPLLLRAGAAGEVEAAGRRVEDGGAGALLAERMSEVVAAGACCGGSGKAAPAAAKSAPAGPSPEEEAKRKEEEEAQAKAEAEEAERKAAEEAEAAKRKAEMEAELARLAALANGEVTIKYNMYAEKFPISEHKLTAATIDELYCLSDVMPGCFIHLSEKEFVHGEEHAYMKEEPPGTFHGLMAGETYWCYVQQDSEQEKQDQEMMRQHWAGATVGGGIGDRGSEGESCSCGWGAPCTNPMICKDWDHRFANAIKAGGNPILFTGT